jgi:hypothetical protein
MELDSPQKKRTLLGWKQLIGLFAPKDLNIYNYLGFFFGFLFWVFFFVFFWTFQSFD